MEKNMRFNVFLSLSYPLITDGCKRCKTSSGYVFSMIKYFEDLSLSLFLN